MPEVDFLGSDAGSLFGHQPLSSDVCIIRGTWALQKVETFDLDCKSSTCLRKHQKTRYFTRNKVEKSYLPFDIWGPKEPLKLAFAKVLFIAKVLAKDYVYIHNIVSIAYV